MYTSTYPSPLGPLTLQSDGEALTLPVTAYDILDTTTRQSGSRPGTAPRSTKTYNERIRITLNRAALNRFSRATSVEFNLFKTPFTLTRDNLATFVAIRERVDMRR